MNAVVEREQRLEAFIHGQTRKSICKDLGTPPGENGAGAELAQERSDTIAIILLELRFWCQATLFCPNEVFVFEEVYCSKGAPWGAGSHAALPVG
jgi:hypothetical protein